MKIKETLSRYGMLGVLIVLIIFFSFAAESFFTKQNIVNVLRQFSMLGISAVGMTLVILTAGIDLSVGSNMGLTGVIAALFMVNFGVNWVLSCIIALIGAVVLGLVNGLAVTKFKVPPLITTLATLTSARGLAYILTGGLPIFGFPKAFNVLGRGMVFAVPVPVLIMIAVFGLGFFVLKKTRYGRHLYAIGGNPEAARLSGIPVKKNLILTYVFSSVFTGIAGLILLSRLNSCQPSTGVGFEMDVITAVVLGGISIAGGEGRFGGVVIGILIIGVLTNGMIMMNVYEYYQQLIKGIVLLVAVGADQYSKTRGSQTV